MRARSLKALPGGEKVDLVNEKDAVVGSSSVLECLSKGLLHRAVAVLVLRSDGRFLLQRRSTKDRWHPGKWTISSTGHVKQGESYDKAAARELQEELGLTGSLERVGKYLLPPLHSTGLTEWEWVAFYVTQTDSPCTVDPVELEEVREYEESALRTLLQGEELTPDAGILIGGYLRNPSRRA